MPDRTPGRVATMFALIVVAGLAAGCAAPPSNRTSSPSPSASSADSPAAEAAETRELEEKAQGYKDRFEEIQASDMSADEKARAASELVNEQQQAIQESDAGGGGDAPN